MIQRAVRDHLAADPDVANLVEDRIGPMRAATSRKLPYITYQVISQPRDYHLLGPSGHVTANVQIDVWSDSAVEAETLGNAVRMAFDGFYGVMGDQAVNVKGTTVTGPSTGFDAPIDGSEGGTFRATLEVQIGYIEDVQFTRRMRKVS